MICRYRFLLQINTSIVSLFLFSTLCKQEISKYHNTKSDPVPSKYLEIVFLDITHQELDRCNGNAKSDNHTKQQIYNLCSGKMQTKFYQFQKACSKHNRDGKEKGIFRCQFSAHAEENTPDDGCTGTGSTRNQGKQLEDSDKQCIFERNITELCSAGLPAFIFR